MRAPPDVSLAAHPRSGDPAFDTVRDYGQSGWFTVGGTSVSSPIWAARSADSEMVAYASFIYGANISYPDITSVNNGAPCLVGSDSVTGLGSWTGTTP